MLLCIRLLIALVLAGCSFFAAAQIKQPHTKLQRHEWDTILGNTGPYAHQSDSISSFIQTTHPSITDHLQKQLDSAEKNHQFLNSLAQVQIQSLSLQNLYLQRSKRYISMALMACTVVFSLLLLYAYYRRYKMLQASKIQAIILKQQEMATKAILEAEEAERQRIAKDLHDGLGQMMSAVKMNLSALESQLAFHSEEQKNGFKKIIQLVDDSCREVRSVSHNMMPNTLLKNSLDAAIREFVDKLDQKALKVHLYTDGIDKRMDRNVETVLYRIVQECVHNTIKHSGANAIDISIIKEANEIRATIEDNGKGFNSAQMKDINGMGLKNIRSRIEFLKGSFDIDSTPGQGTLIALHIPL